MNESDFPAIYQSADRQSVWYQRFFILSLTSNLICMIVFSILSTINIPDKNFAIFQSIILFIGFCLTIYLIIAKPQEVWYGARALAESIKTMTWRYMMRAEPYNGSDQDARAHFLLNLRKLLDANKKISSLTVPVDDKEITIKMESVRAFNIEERKQLYKTDRIEDQRKWYIRKSRANKNRAIVFFSAICIAYLIMIIFSIARPAYPDIKYWPTDVLVTIASSILAWTQTKRYQELSASYSLTAREINLLSAEFPKENKEVEFSGFVGDAENAFSREHTQWQARRDQD
jgi:hypothetical protein